MVRGLLAKVAMRPLGGLGMGFILSMTASWLNMQNNLVQVLAVANESVQQLEERFEVMAVRSDGDVQGTHDASPG